MEDAISYHHQHHPTTFATAAAAATAASTTAQQSLTAETSSSSGAVSLSASTVHAASVCCDCQLCQARDLMAWARQAARSGPYCAAAGYATLMMPPPHQPTDGLYPVQNPSTAGLTTEVQHQQQAQLQHQHQQQSLHHMQLHHPHQQQPHPPQQHELYDYAPVSRASYQQHSQYQQQSHYLHQNQPHQQQQCGDDCSSASPISLSDLSIGCCLNGLSQASVPVVEPEYPAAYISDDGIAHLRLNKHIAMEVSDYAIRVINNRNNSALAVSSAASIGSLYHYNCRGWFDTSAQRVALAFDRDCDLMLRAPNRPSLVRKGREYYRLTQSGINRAKEESIYIAHEDLTHQRLFRRNSDENFPLLVHEMVKGSKVCRDASGAINLDLCSVRVELQATGELRVWWTGPDRFVNQLIVSPTSGAFTLITNSLEIVNTPKCEVTVKFGCVSILLGLRQLQMSNGVKNCLLDLYPMDAFGWGCLPPDYYSMASACLPQQQQQHQQQQHPAVGKHQHHQFHYQQQHQQHHQYQHGNPADYSTYEDTEDDAPAWFIRQQQARRFEQQHHQQSYQHQRSQHQQQQQQQQQQHEATSTTTDDAKTVTTTTTTATATCESADEDADCQATDGLD